MLTCYEQGNLSFYLQVYLNVRCYITQDVLPLIICIEKHPEVIRTDLRILVFLSTYDSNCRISSWMLHEILFWSTTIVLSRAKVCSCSVLAMYHIVGHQTINFKQKDLFWKFGYRNFVLRLMVTFDCLLAGSQDSRTTVLEKERTEVTSSAEETEDKGIVGAVKNAVGWVSACQLLPDECLCIILWGSMRASRSSLNN